MSMGPSASRHAPARGVSLRLLRKGLRRVRRGKGFAYLRPDGRAVAAREALRVAELGIPPAWTDVRISPSEGGQLQAIGYDAAGRLQYLYHPRFRARRDAAKFDRLRQFARALPAIRRRVRRDLARPGLSRETVLAAAVRLLDRSFVRIGSEEYARDNESFGLATLRNRHARIRGAEIVMRFRGKSHVVQELRVVDRSLVRVLRGCLKLPGAELLGYRDDSGVHDVTSKQVNEYLRQIAGQSITAKDFRTWAGSVLAVQELIGLPPPGTTTQTRRVLAEAVCEVSKRLNNTKAVCRRSYIHPLVFQAFESGRLQVAARRTAKVAELSRHEALFQMLLAMPRRRLPRSA